MSKTIRRSKKLNSESENHFLYDDETAAHIGPVPYDGVCDFSKNSIAHILDSLYIEDNNYFQRKSFEWDYIKHVYKI